jgi:hypothetical protein
VERRVGPSYSSVGSERSGGSELMSYDVLTPNVDASPRVIETNVPRASLCGRTAPLTGRSRSFVEHDRIARAGSRVVREAMIYAIRECPDG